MVRTRVGRNLLAVVDETDGFPFLLKLSRDRLARGWRLDDRDQTQRNRAQRKGRHANRA